MIVVFGFYRGCLSVTLYTFPGYPDTLATGILETTGLNTSYTETTGTALGIQKRIY